MKIAIAQLNYIIGDFEGNARKIKENIRKAKEQGADVVAFSEYAVCGSPAYDLLNNAIFLSACERSVKEIAAECKGITALVGTPLRDENNRTISGVAVIQDGAVTQTIGKKIITQRDELAYITPSKGCEYIKVNGKWVAIVLGDDVFDEQEFGAETDTIINLSSARFFRGIVERKFDYFSGLAVRNNKNVVYLNQVGGQSDVIYYGNSLVLNKKGKAAAILKKFDEDFITVDLRQDLPGEELPEQNRTANVHDAMIFGLKDYFRKNGFGKACLGLSGGIDSAVVCAMTVEALGAENVHVFMLPSMFSTDHSVTDAVTLAQTLGVRYDVINIETAYHALTQTLKPVFGNAPFDTAEENIQSRIRGLILMAMSNKYGYILLNASNKSEIAVGYETLYGDSVGALSPIGDLYKREVYQLARYINRQSEIIPQSIIEKEPSAELRPGQKDADSLPPYDILDAILHRIIEYNQSPDEITEAGFEPEVVARIFDLLYRSEFKRRQLSPAFRFSQCPLGQRRVMPLTARNCLK